MVAKAMTDTDMIVESDFGVSSLPRFISCVGSVKKKNKSDRYFSPYYLNLTFFFNNLIFTYECSFQIKQFLSDNSKLQIFP